MMEDDIFMEYAESGSFNETGNFLNIPKIGNSFEDVLKERDVVSSNIKNHFSSSPNVQETRLKVLHLRQFNRHVSNIIRDHRKRLNELKDIVDNLNNKLLCQKFEKQHLLDEIKSCLNSKNIFESIELEELNVDSSSLTFSEKHESMIKRLHGELTKRQEFQARLMSILQKKQQTESELDKKKRKIEDLRGHLQNLLKNSKPLAEACGYDMEAFHKKKMSVDETDILESSETIEDLSAIYEKLVTFVADKPDFKLRHFDSIVQEKDEEDLERCGEDEGRNFSIKSSYIQVKMEITGSDSIEPVEIFLKLLENQNSTLPVLLFSIHHEMIPDNSVATWLKGLGTIEFDPIDFSNWLAPLKLQPDSLNFVQNSEVFENIFTSIKEAIQVRHKLISFVEGASGILEFDKSNLNELVFLPSKSIKAQVAMNSITWFEAQDGAETGINDELISSLNAIGLKYRSVLDCLQAQLELLLKQ